MQNRFTRWIMLAFLGCLAGLTLYVNAQRPRILVVHSYHTDYIWTQQINQGLERIFRGRSLIDIQYHYMNVKNFKEKSNLRRAGIAARHAVDAIRPDILLVVDDDAQALVAQHYVKDPTIQIVHAGINNDPESYGYSHADNVTGILERKPLAAIKDLLLLVGTQGREKRAAHGGGDQEAVAPAIRALFLSDRSTSVRMDAQFLETFAWAPVEYKGNLAVQSFREWQDVIRRVDELADIVLVGGYRELTREGGAGFVTPQEVMRWTEAHSARPVIGMNLFNAADGAMLSLGISPFEQGEVAARMALRILDHGVKAATIPTRMPEQYVVSMRHSLLAKRGIQLPSIFEAFSRSTNSFFE
ncbi:MAG: hypothetical protein H7837_07870 [Magnetococcus sp. MYC-9]